MADTAIPDRAAGAILGAFIGDALALGPQLVTDSSFDAFVSSYPGPVLAEFWSPG